jgi:hypothetical protein
VRIRIKEGNTLHPHAGLEIPPGSVIDRPDEDARALVRLGVAVEVPPDTPLSPPPARSRGPAPETTEAPKRGETAERPRPKRRGR